MNIEDIKENWDLIVVGGGITGAGILREATRAGLNVLLLEQKDFAWGTSSRSSKMVHGGLRYLKEGRILLTRDSVIERERLLKEGPGLIEPLGFIMPVYSDHGPGRWLLKAGLFLYDLIARKRQHKFFKRNKFLKIAPDVKKEGLVGGFRFFDAQVDDARLVQRLINESIARGAEALNYTPVKEIVRNSEGNVVGVIAEDAETNKSRTFYADAVINASGAWAETLHPSPTKNLHIRPLRGSHLIFPASALPITETVSFVHPEDNRPVFITPWEGVLLLGTTDVDYKENLLKEPKISRKEADYLMDVVKTFFPNHPISLKDCIATIAGVRPVLSKGKLDPSKESREHVVWIQKGLVTVTGGKLTTFRKLAEQTLKAVTPFLKTVQPRIVQEPVFTPMGDVFSVVDKVSPETWRRIYGRHGENAETMVKNAKIHDLETVPGTQMLWAEFPIAARYERVKHLADLLLRRVRIGLLTPEGGKEYFDRVQELCEPELKWGEERWKKERIDYLDLWMKAYAVPV
jgi:glycerol-3-phosphate dehydrogenase